MTLLELRSAHGGVPVSGFTPVDLLTTLALVGILASLLLLGFIRDRTEASGIRCLDNERQLMLAMHLYAADFQELLPPNEDNNNRWDGWVAGDMTVPGEATNTVFLTDPRYAKLAKYTSPDASLYRCPADSSTVAFGTNVYPRVRSVSMNQAVGTKRDGKSPVDGPWLSEGTYGNNTAQAGPYRSYGRLCDMVQPSPARLWVLADEDPWSINDGALAVTIRANPASVEWIDRPASFHGLACGFAFADGHAEIHHWQDSRTALQPGVAPRATQPNNADIRWVMERTSAKR